MSHDAVVTDTMDELTGLLHRKQFCTQASEILQRAANAKSGKQFFLVYTNIRHFKYYNIKYGAGEGNRVLARWADFLQTNGFGVLYARFNADHFVFLSDRADLKEQMEEACEAFNGLYGKDGISLKVGVYAFGGVVESIETACDLAKYACDSIRDEHESFCVYDDTLEHNLQLETYVIQNIDRCLENQYIEVVYQPVVRTINGKLCSMEALARWDDPDYGRLSPAEFIPALERNQLITKLDLYILREVCRELHEKEEKGYNTVPISINLSRMDFLVCDIVEEVEKAVKEYDIARDSIYIEITETMIMTKRDVFERDIRRFRESGYQVWMDDFGSGYSSLNILREFDIDEIKLDMMFLHTFDAKTRQVIRSVISMAKQLRISTLAEGVETKEQYDFLREIGCEKVQGYYISKPIRAKQVKELYAGRENEIETRLWRKCFEHIGKINFITERPLAIGIYEGKSFDLLYTNEAYRAVWKSLGIEGPEVIGEIINSKSSPVWVQFRELISRLQVDGNFDQIEFPLNEHYVRIRTKLLYQLDETQLFQVELINLTRRQSESKTDKMDFVYRMMYAMYDTVHIFDLDTDRMEVVMPGSNYNSLLKNGQQVNDIRTATATIASEMIGFEDRLAFLEFMDFSTLRERITNEDKQYITKMFRTRSSNGSYVWGLHTIQLIPGTNKIIYSHRFVPHLYEQMREQMEEIVKSDRMGQLIWEAMRDSDNINMFWKDTDRRFMGANGHFLETYGFESQKDIVGKNDEDMGWHVDNDPFRDDELAVLKEGRSMPNRLGKCIVRGVVHDILATKEPLYDNGKLVGLVGTFNVLDSMQKEEDRIGPASIDEVTGLMSADEIERLTKEYAEGWEYQKEKFAVITFEYTSFRRTEQTYGKKAAREILAGIGEFIIQRSGNNYWIGRTYGASFVLVSRYRQRSEIKRIVDDIRTQSNQIHEICGYNITLNTQIETYFAEDMKDIREMINIVRGGVAERLEDKTNDS